jgi:hypothetical protein
VASCRPFNLFFPSGARGQQREQRHGGVNTTLPSAERLVGRRVSSAGSWKKVTPHVMRHCFATHLLKSGVDIAVIQALLGHGSLRATQVYTHVSVEHIGRVKSPLDLLGTPRRGLPSSCPVLICLCARTYAGLNPRGSRAPADVRTGTTEVRRSSSQVACRAFDCATSR